MKPITWFALLIAAFLSLAGCSRPTQADRDNRRVLEEVLTAITLRNERLLDAAAARVAQRHAAGELDEADRAAIQALVEQAKTGDWGGAETAAYAFRRQRPFVAPGQ